MARNLLLLSTSTIHGSAFMDYCIDEISDHFKGIDEILFVPYAQPSGISLDDYTAIARNRLAKVGISVKGIHEFDDKVSAIRRFKGIYIGGGNTFLLTKQMYEHNVVDHIREAVLYGEMRYMGSSAGTNIACKTINNTNDMPIVYPPSFSALGLIPFNINPHYLDPDKNSTHKGETRETRIKEFHFVDKIPVLGLREGSWLKIVDDDISLGGKLTARLFLPGEEAREISSEEDLSFLLS